MPDQYQNQLLNERWLRWADFWVRRRDQFRRVIAGLLIVFSGALYLFSGYVALDYFVLSSDRDAATLLALTTAPDFTLLREIRRPQPISTRAIVVLPTAEPGAAHDVIGRLFNPNERWVARVTYRFGEGEVGEVVMPPGEERFVIGAGAAPSTSQRPSLIFDDISWERVRDIESLNARKPQFNVSDPVLVPGGTFPGGLDRPTQVNFTIANESIFGFWEVGLTVVLLQGDAPLAARRIVIERLLSEEQREVSINFFESVPTATSTLVFTDVDLFDETNFIFEEGPRMRF